MNRQRYRETLLQWVWKELQFNCSGLQTLDGQNVEIADPGQQNPGRGPDFLQAAIRVGGLDWHGAVEVHYREREWFEHAHHEDSEFDRVVLHVVFECNSRRAMRAAGGSVPTLDLSQYLEKPLARLLAVNQRSRLPCAGNLSFISREAFIKQVEIAHQEYFTYKADELLKFYSAGSVPSVAWKEMLVQGFYRALGIPRNRRSMERLAGRVATREIGSNSLTEWICQVEEIAFGKDTLLFNWNRSGMRPASRPAARVVQAASLHYAVHSVPMDEFIQSGIHAWKAIEHLAGRENLPGASRREIVRGTVFLPAIYILGDLFFSKKLKSSSYEAWLQLRATPPQEVASPYKRAGFEVSGKVHCLGLAHLYKRYCLEKRCHQCKVFKSAINS
jgi:hypothetical protein